MKTACPRCGANVSFMPSTQKFYCEYCGCQVDVSEFNVDDYEKDLESNVSAQQSLNNNLKVENNNVESKYKTVDSLMNNLNTEPQSEYNEYTCSTCGAQLLADTTTTVTDCAYCGSRQIMKAKFKGEFRPKELIPFKIDRNQFISMYTNFVKKKILAPEEFKNNPRLMETKGIYVPFNLFFFDVDTYARGEAVKSTRDGTTYKYFEKEFSMKMIAPEDSSKKFDDNVMATLEPFDFRELKKFNPVFLNGFLSENGNENMEYLERKAEARGLNETQRYLASKLEGHTMQKGKIHANFKKLESRYVLLPVWFINTWYNNKLYSYAINGQTGKIVGEIPLSKSKFTALMAVLGTLAVLATLFLLFLSFESDSDEDGVGDLIVWIWVGVVGAYAAIKKRYKNVNSVLENPIQTWDVKVKKDNKFSKGQYKKTFGDVELTRMDRQLFRNGVNVKDLNRPNTQMNNSYINNTHLNNNYSNSVNGRGDSTTLNNNYSNNFNSNSSGPIQMNNTNGTNIKF